MNDLDAVALREHCARPVGAAHDLTVEFDCQALRGEREMKDETVEGQMIRHLTILPVNRNKQKTAPHPC